MTARPPLNPLANASRSAWRIVASAAAPEAAADNLLINLGKTGWSDLVNLCGDKSGKVAAIGYMALASWVEEFGSDAERDEAAPMIRRGQLDRRPRVRLACVEASFGMPVLIRLMFDVDGRVSNPIRGSLLDDSDHRVRVAALRRMSDVRPDSRVARRIVRAVGESHRKVREAAIAALSDEPTEYPPLRFPRDLDLFHAVASGKGRYSPEARGDAAAAMAVRRDRRSIELIARQLQNPFVDPAWVRAAELAGSTRLIAPLQRLAELGWADAPLRGSARFRRRALGEALWVLREQGTPPRRKGEGGPRHESSSLTPDHRHKAAALPHPLAGSWNPLDRRQRRALVRVGNDAGLMCAWLRSPNSLLRAAALCAIEWSDEPLATASAARAARDGLIDDPACLVRMAAACTSGRAQDRDAAATCLINDPCPLVRISAMDTMARNACVEIEVGALRDALSDPVVEVRALAASVVARRSGDLLSTHLGDAILEQLSAETERSVCGTLALAAVLLDLDVPVALVADELRSPYAPVAIVRAAEFQPRSEYPPALMRLRKIGWAAHMPHASDRVLRRAIAQGLEMPI